jgi:hypothetical protein
MIPLDHAASRYDMLYKNKNKNLVTLVGEQKFDRLLYLSKKLPKEKNRPIGENSPNLVTLVGGHWAR